MYLYKTAPEVHIVCGIHPSVMITLTERFPDLLIEIRQLSYTAEHLHTILHGRYACVTSRFP
jgi:hypothetical protein